MTTSQTSALSTPLITAETLSNWLQTYPESIRILDASYALPNETRNPAQEYAESHIPGAVFFEIDKICDKSSPYPHMLPTPEAFSEAMVQLGIGHEHTVVVYDRNGMKTAPRVWWTFKAFGHPKLFVLEGGFHAWQQAGYPVTMDVPTYAKTLYQAAYQPALVRSFQQVQANSQSPSPQQVVDVRSRERFYGEAPEPRPGLRSGHIPGSKNLPFPQLLDPETQCFLPPEQLKVAFQQAGVDITQPTTFTCGSGLTACIGALAMAQLGNTAVSVYDASWAEWGAVTEG
jgi:thiosulfate/3-mercaptopyruvate sulfurtransferase